MSTNMHDAQSEDVQGQGELGLDGAEDTLDSHSADPQGEPDMGPPDLLTSNRFSESAEMREPDMPSDPLLAGQQPRQPRPDQVEPEEPLGAPADPFVNDPSRVQGDPAEDDM